jgi:hypothetical protein
MKLKREDFDVLVQNPAQGGTPPPGGGGGGGGEDMTPPDGVRMWPPPKEGGEGGEEIMGGKPNTPEPEDDGGEGGGGEGQSQPGEPKDQKGSGKGKGGEKREIQPGGGGEGGEPKTVYDVEKIVKGKSIGGNTLGETMTAEQSKKLQEELDIPIEVPTEADANKIKDIAKQKIQDAVKTIGKGKGNWIRAIAAHLLPKIDWKKALKDFIGKALSGSEDVLPARRHVGRGDYITGERPKYDALQNAVIAVDTSGSMGDEELSIILTEIAGIISAKKVKKTRIVYFDDGLQGEDEVGNPPKFDLDKAGGGGGTSFMEPLRYMNDEFKKGKLDIAVFCTDGFADLNLPRPKYVEKFVWVILDNPAFPAPWGKMVVHISTKDVK